MSFLSKGEPVSTVVSELESTVHRSIRDVNEGQLNNLVAQSDSGTLFHRHEWLRAVEDAYECEPRHVIASKDGNPVGFLPNVAHHLSLPHDLAERVADALSLLIVETPPPGCGGPIMVGGDERETLDALFDAIDLTQGSNTLFHRVHSYDLEAVRYARYIHSRGYKPRITECNFFIDLRDGWETIRENMDKERRKGMRRATDQDYDVEITRLGEDLERTYEAYRRNTERAGGNRMPRAFFENLAERVPERVRVFRASVDGVEVGRYVHLLDEESSTLHHWLSAIASEADFEYYPSELLHRRAIRWAIEQGYDKYGFGPTNPHFSDSVFQFKEKFGGEAVPSLQWEKGSIPLAWQLYDAGRSWYLR